VQFRERTSKGSGEKRRGRKVGERREKGEWKKNGEMGETEGASSPFAGAPPVDCGQRGWPLRGLGRKGKKVPL